MFNFQDILKVEITHSVVRVYYYAILKVLNVLSLSLCLQLPVFAKSLGKRVFKRHLELFLDSIFYGLVSYQWECHSL